MSATSVQQQFAPNNRCFGCGPANDKGLRIQSREEGDALVADWTPEPHHEAFSGMVNGGIIGTLLDCHCNWAAAMSLMKKLGLEAPPCTVTAEYAIKLKRPTPSNQTLHLKAWVVDSTDDRVVVEGSLEAEGKVCATARGKFVAVKPGHPAYHRW